MVMVVGVVVDMVVAAQVAVAEVSRSRRIEGAAAVVLAAAGVEQEVAVDTRTAGAVWEIRAKSTRNTRDEAQSGKRIDQHHRSNENNGLLLGQRTRAAVFGLNGSIAPACLPSSGLLPGKGIGGLLRS